MRRSAPQILPARPWRPRKRSPSRCLRGHLPRLAPAPSPPLHLSRRACSEAGRSRLQSASGEGFAVGGVYQFSPYTMTLTPPATLVITYTAEALGTSDPNLLHVYRWRAEEANWQPLNAVHDIPAAAMTTPIGQLGTYTIGYDAAPPIITMMQPTAVVTQTHLPQFSAVITDTGSGVAPASVELRLNGQLVAATYTPLNGYLSYTSAAILPNRSYPYTVTARDTAGNEATSEGSFTVSVPAPTVLGTDPPAVPYGIAAKVTITGQNFSHPPAVWVDGLAMTDVSYQGLTAIGVTLPANLALGPHSVMVTAPDGQSGSKAAAITVVESTALKPLVPTVIIARTLKSLELMWQHQTRSTEGYPASVAFYEVWHGSGPDFSPGGAGTSLVAKSHRRLGRQMASRSHIATSRWIVRNKALL